MHGHIPNFCFLLILLTRLGAFAAVPEHQTGRTYCVGRTDSAGKLYRYCRLLSVDILRGPDASFELAYDVTDDQGKSLPSGSGRLALQATELEAFITICSQAWDLVYNRSEAPQPGSIAILEKFRGEAATYVCDAYGTSHLTIKWPGAPPDNPNFLSLPMEGVCVTLSLLSRTVEGEKLLGDGKRFRAGIRTEAVTTPFKEQEEIDLSGSIIKKFDAGNWDTWKMWVIYEGLDFRRLSGRERQYLSKVFARRGPPSEAKTRMNSDTSFIVRLKLSDPETLQDLREAFRVGYFDAADAADACRRAANVRLLSIAAEFLFTDKAPKEVEMSDVIVDASPSIHSAAAIGALLAVCPEFPEPVRKAAKTWEQYGSTSQDFLSSCRKWWSKNQQRIKNGKYNEVTAPTSRK
jgi:hypothetical protein